MLLSAWCPSRAGLGGFTWDALPDASPTVSVSSWRGGGSRFPPKPLPGALFPWTPRGVFFLDCPPQCQGQAGVRPFSREVDQPPPPPPQGRHGHLPSCSVPGLVSWPLAVGFSSDPTSCGRVRWQPQDGPWPACRCLSDSASVRACLPGVPYSSDSSAGLGEGFKHLRPHCPTQRLLLTAHSATSMVSWLSSGDTCFHKEQALSSTISGSWPGRSGGLGMLRPDQSYLLSDVEYRSHSEPRCLLRARGVLHAARRSCLSSHTLTRRAGRGWAVRARLSAFRGRSRCATVSPALLRALTFTLLG